jgi:DNA-binding NarL/FixJ family response regulator
VRILLADGHEGARRMLSQLLSKRLSWSICAEAVTGREAIALARQFQPDIGIIDIDISEGSGLDAARRIGTVSSRTKVLVLTRYASDLLARDVQEAGANGYIVKADAVHQLVPAIEALASGLTFFPDSGRDLSMNFTGFNLNELRRAIPPRGLTPREREVVRLVAEGKSSREVARVLNISIKTVETHRTNVMRKLNIHSSSDLVRYAIDNDLVES